MIRTHSYDVTVAWTGNRGSGTSGYREYGRDHQVNGQQGDAGRPGHAPDEQPLRRSPTGSRRCDPCRCPKMSLASVRLELNTKKTFLA